MLSAEEWTAIGYIDYPSCRHFPYRDKNNLTNENNYINGWNKAQRESFLNDHDSEFGKDTYAANY